MAQEAKEVQELKQQLKQLQDQFEKQQQLQRQQIEALKKQIESLQQTQAASPAVVPPVATPAPEPGMLARPWSPADPIRIGSGSVYADLGLVGMFAVGTSTVKDIEGGTQLGGHDPNQRGFSVQGVEMNLQGNVDPYFRANANILFQINREGESFVEVEEAYLDTLSLPGGLQLRGGQFYSEFGRQNPTHPHTWSFVDLPLVNARLLGGDGLRNPGGRVSWLVPTPFYSELFLGVQNSGGATANSFRSGGHTHGGEAEEGLPFSFRHADNDRGLSRWSDLLFTPRYAVSFDLTDTQTLLLGTSAAFGPNSRGGAGSGELATQIYGADLMWKWKSKKHHGGFPFVQFQAEAMLRDTEVGLFDWDEDGNGGDGDGDGSVDAGVLIDPTVANALLPGEASPALLQPERLRDYGFYTQLLYGFRKGWVAGIRYDYVAPERGAYENRGLVVSDGTGGGAGDPAGLDLFRVRRHRISPNLTWYPSEFSKIRLQYNYDDREQLRDAHSIWLQFEFSLGAHAAHKF